MATKAENLLRILEENLGKLLLGAEISRVGEVRIKLAAEQLIETMLRLRDDEALSFCQLIDLCGIDYSDYPVGGEELPRFATIYHLLSLRHNWRLRVQVFAPADMPVLSSVNGVWPAANWYEREAFDLFGIIYDGHDDLRRILTDYGFIGHPFRKDFPLHGHVEMRYDAATGRVVYAPVTIDNRITVPRVSRSDHRYEHPGQPRG